MLQKPDYFDGSEDAWMHGIGEVFRGAVRYNGMLLRFATPAIRADKQTVMTAVALDGLALQFACEELRQDEEVVNTAIQSQSDTCLFAGHAPLSPFAFASDALKIHRGLALVACKQSGSAFKFVPECLTQDETFLRECLQHNGANLRLMFPELRQNKDLVRVAMENDVRSLVYAHESLWTDPELLSWAASKNDDFLGFWKGGSWTDAEGEAKARVASTLAELPMWLLLELGRTSRNNMREVCVLFPDDVRVAKEVAGSWFDLHDLLHQSVFENRDVVEAFAAVHGKVILKSESYALDPSIVAIAVKTSPEIFKWLSDEIRDNKDVALSVVSTKGEFFKHVSERLMRDREVCMQAALNYSAALIYVHDSVKNDLGFVRELMYKIVETQDVGSMVSVFSSEFFTSRNAFVMLNDAVIRACCHVMDYRCSISCGSVDTRKVAKTILEDIPRLAVFAKTPDEFDTAVATIAKHVPHEGVQTATQEAHAAYYRPKDASGQDSATLSEWKRSAPVELSQGAEGEAAAKRPRTSELNGGQRPDN